jgi:hypothetical protein
MKSGVAKRDANRREIYDRKDLLLSGKMSDIKDLRLAEKVRPTNSCAEFVPGEARKRVRRRKCGSVVLSTLQAATATARRGHAPALPIKRTN